MTPNKPEAFIETSVVRQKLFGHPKTRIHIKEKIKDYHHYTSFFVWMEYKRGLIINFIEFYFVLKSDMHETVQDAITWWSEDFSIRRLKDISIDITQWLEESGAINNKEQALIKLKSQIFRIYCSFEQWFPKRNFVHNKTGCELAKIKLAGIKDEDLNTFYKIFDKHLDIKCNIRKFLATNKSKLEKIKKVDKATTDGFKRQVENIKDLKIEAYCCKDCAKIGDTIIALECPINQKLFSMDKIFGKLCPLLGKKYEILPSTRTLLPSGEVLKELKS